MPMAVAGGRFVWRAVADGLETDFVRTARAKGLSERVVIRRHALRHALLPVVTLLGLQAGRLMAGTLIVETVFAWPGIGRLTIDSIDGGDFPVTRSSCASIMLANIFVDLSYRVVDPRIRAGAA